MKRFTPDDIRAGDAELMTLAGVLDTAYEKHSSAGDPTYDQATFCHGCGTPACAIGHRRAMLNRPIYPVPNGTFQKECRELALDMDEYEELFGSDGCGNALSAKEAAAYIRAFVERREKALAGEA